MRIYFSGCENPTWRQLAVDAGAQHLALSLTSLRRRLPKTKDYLLSERLPDGVTVGMEPGDLAKRELTDDELVTWAEAYERAVKPNQALLDYVVEIDAWEDPALRAEWRQRLAEASGGCMMPIWKPEDGYDELDGLAWRYGGVALPEVSLDDQRVRRMLLKLSDGGAVLHALGATKIDDLLRLPLTSASSTSWTSPARYGDTIVWDGKRLHRYPVAYRDQARRRHRNDITEAGLDYEKVEHDEEDEVTKLAVWSLRQLEQAVATTTPRSRERAELAGPPEEVTTALAEREQASQLPVRAQPARERPDRELLPVLGMTEVVNKDDEIEGHTVAPQTVRPLMQCDSCHLAKLCDKYEPESACAFNIPVTMLTTQDVDRFLVGILEMQGQRVLFGSFAEQLQGGYPDPNLSNEIDRLFKLTEKLKEIRDNRQFVRMTMEAHAGNGVLSRIFGGNVGQQAAMLDEPIEANALAASVDP